MDGSDLEWIRSHALLLGRIYRISGILFFACGETPFGRMLLYPDDLVNPVNCFLRDRFVQKTKMLEKRYIK